MTCEAQLVAAVAVGKLGREGTQIQQRATRKTSASVWFSHILHAFFSLLLPPFSSGARYSNLSHLFTQYTGKHDSLLALPHPTEDSCPPLKTETTFLHQPNGK